MDRAPRHPFGANRDDLADNTEGRSHPHPHPHPNSNPDPHPRSGPPTGRPDLLTLAEVALELRITRQVVNDWILKGVAVRGSDRRGTGERLRLAGVRLPNAWRIRRQDLDAFLAACAAANGVPAVEAEGTSHTPGVDALIEAPVYPPLRSARGGRRAGVA